MRKSTLLCLLSFAALAACSEDDTPRGVSEGEVLLQVAATGRTEARPDEARFTVGVSTNAATAAAASTGNATAMTRVMAALQRLGIKADDVQTRSITLARIDYGPERGRFTANNLVEVQVRDLKVVGQAIAAASEAGGNVVSGPDLRLSDPERADNAAYAAAYKAARARADAYAQAAGLKVRRVLAIRDGSADGPPIAYGYTTSETGAAVSGRLSAPSPVSPRAAAPFQGGVTTREVTVRADFALGR
jgi:uncharacterized protein YggE